MRFKLKLIVNIIIIFCLLAFPTLNISAKIEIYKSENIEINKNLIKNTTNNEIDTLRFYFIHSYWNSLNDHEIYNGLNVKIVNHGAKIANGNWYIRIRNPPLNIMDGKWNEDFSLKPNEELFIKVMPDKIFEFQGSKFFRCGKIDIEFTVNNKQKKATGFVWCNYILNLQEIESI